MGDLVTTGLEWSPACGLAWRGLPVDLPGPLSAVVPANPQAPCRVPMVDQASSSAGMWLRSVKPAHTRKGMFVRGAS